MASFASLVYGSNPTRRSVRAVMDGGRASFSRSSAAAVAARPAHGVAMSDARVLIPAGMRFAPHRGCPPWETGCLCDCHGTGDANGKHDVPSCVDVISAC